LEGVFGDVGTTEERWRHLEGKFWGWRHLKRDFGGVAAVEGGFVEERKRNEERNRGRWWI